MTGKSLFRHGRSVLKADVAANETAAADAQAALVAANRERLRLDAPTVDPTLLQGRLLAFVRGRGWFVIERVNGKTVTVHFGNGEYGRVPFAQIVDFR